MKFKQSNRTVLSFVLSILLVFCAFPGAVFADSSFQSIAVRLDNEPLQFHTSAYCSGDTAMLPLRDLANQLGFDVYWGASVNSAFLLKENEQIAVVTPDSNNYTYLEETHFSGSPAVLLNEKTYIPSDMAETIFSLTGEFNQEYGILSLHTAATDPAAAADDGIIRINSTEDTYVQAGSTANNNFGAADILDFKAGTADTNRLIYLKFNLPSLPDEFNTAYLEFKGKDAESRSASVTFNIYESDPDSWSGSDITFNTQPARGELVASVVTTFADTVTMDITEYIKNCAASGKNNIALVLDGDYLMPLRMTFFSTEAGSPPALCISETGGAYVEENLPIMEGFGNGQDPWEYAQQMWNTSQFQKTDSAQSDELILTPSESTYVTAGSNNKNVNYGNEQVIETKLDTPTSSVTRVAYLKFDLSDVSLENLDYAYISLYCTLLENNQAHNIELYCTSSDWNESSLTWSTKPAEGEFAATTLVTKTARWFKFNITNALKASAADGETTVSYAIKDTAKLRTAFASSRNTASPTLTLVYQSGNEASLTIPDDDLDEYPLSTTATMGDGSGNTFTFPTRLIDHLPNYNITTQAPALSPYGGQLDETYEATGFYYTKQINNRWWIIDPEGHPMINAAVVNVNAGSSENEVQGRNAKYGTVENWAEQTTDELKNNLYFNGVGAWSTNILDSVSAPLSSAKLVYFLRTYMDNKGLRVENGGSTGFQKGSFDVFDPDFVDFCAEFAAENVAPYKDSDHILGWMSDNELPGDLNMLDDMLNLDPSEPYNAYSYATAWTFLRNYTGKENPSFSDITETMRDDFRDFVYDRYFSVVSSAIKQADPNHLYLGCRFYNPNIDSKGCWSAAGRYCDIISVNYYYTWTPNTLQMSDWYRWSGKPFIATEWYAMAYDSGLACTSGAGFRVATQQERARFYQNFVLKLLETKSCVGFHWFQYLDNDPEATGRDSSNQDGNKGIVNTQFEYYQPLITEMQELNKNIYPLIDYFDARNN